MALRDVNGALIVPMDQLRGLLRHGLVDLGLTGVLDDLFGKGSDDVAKTASGNYTPDRSALFLSDLVAAPIPPADQAAGPMHRVRIDPETGAATEGHLLTLEQVAAPGAEIAFSGDFHAYSSLEVTVLESALSAALQVHGAIGSLKSVGFGEVVTCSATLQDAPATQPLADPGGPRLTMHFSLDRPYLVDPERIADNAYLGRRDIPGGAIKGLLAQNLALCGANVDATALAALRIGQARRVGDTADLLALSVVWDRDENRFADRAHSAAKPGDLHQSGWKSEQEDRIEAVLGNGNPPLRMEERVHTQINADTGAAFDQKLYSTIAVAPDPQGFECALDLTEVAPEQRRALVSALGKPLFGLGMTGATLRPIRMTCLGGADGAQAGHFAIVVKTPALLADPEDTPEDQTGVFASCKAFWSKHLPHSTLKACHARQRLVGGYHALRFRIRPGGYRPWVLTEPGSVFVFDLAAEDVDAMNLFLRRGLCRTNLGDADMDWRNCPFVAENGYGELARQSPANFGSGDAQ